MCPVSLKPYFITVQQFFHTAALYEYNASAVTLSRTCISLVRLKIQQPTSSVDKFVQRPTPPGRLSCGQNCTGTTLHTPAWLLKQRHPAPFMPNSSWTHPCSQGPAPAPSSNLSGIALLALQGVQEDMGADPLVASLPRCS